MTSVANYFLDIESDPDMPNPPRTLVLFWEKKMVWLNNAQQFASFVEEMFKAYEKQNRVHNDLKNWKNIIETLPSLHGAVFEKELLKAWRYTFFAEFSLYGAESVLSKRLSRFTPQERQEIWGAFTVPDEGTFLSQIDDALLSTKDPKAIATKYPWINDGYEGVANNAEEYFSKRLAVLLEDTQEKAESRKDRMELTKKFVLTKAEISTLTLTRELALFMDKRKAWMMQTRRLLTGIIGTLEYGWLYDDRKSLLIGKEDTESLWMRYVNFRSADTSLTGIVASNGGKHFISGEVVIVSSPIEAVSPGKIIVVPSTSPSYVPLMRGAKALITDHGGMMSHAAIVAREFNLPCIVGTKQATKVLKNGDVVVLDLVTGEVNK